MRATALALCGVAGGVASSLLPDHQRGEHASAFSLEARKRASCLRSLARKRSCSCSRRRLSPQEYFEYIDLLTSVLRHPLPQTRPFTVVEVGCGFCYWTVSALLAARRRLGGGARLRFLSVDASEEMLTRCRQQLADNGIEAGLGDVALGAIVASSETASVFFANPGNYGGNVGGVSVEGPPAPRDHATEREVPATTLTRLLKDTFGVDGSIIDLLDVDIQGSEGDAFDAHMDLLDRRVKLVHVGSHGTLHRVSEPLFSEGNEIERAVLAAFDAHGWTRRFVFPRTSMHCEPSVFAATPFGPVCFADGVLSFENPRLAGE